MLQVLDKAMLAKADMAQQVLTLLLLVMHRQILHAALGRDLCSCRCCLCPSHGLVLPRIGPACAIKARHAQRLPAVPIRHALERVLPIRLL